MSGHRGSIEAGLPEHSIVAFEASFAEGASILESDLPLEVGEVIRSFDYYQSKSILSPKNLRYLGDSSSKISRPSIM